MNVPQLLKHVPGTVISIINEVNRLITILTFNDILSCDIGLCLLLIHFTWLQIIGVPLYVKTQNQNTTLLCATRGRRWIPFNPQFFLQSDTTHSTNRPSATLGRQDGTPLNASTCSTHAHWLFYKASDRNVTDFRIESEGRVRVLISRKAGFDVHYIYSYTSKNIYKLL